jgi:hypothetical protein
MEREKDIALTLLAAVESAHFFSARLPSKMTVRKFATDPEARQAVIDGVVESVVLSMLLMGTVALLTKSTLPLWVGGATVAVMSYLTIQDLNQK